MKRSFYVAAFDAPGGRHGGIVVVDGDGRVAFAAPFDVGVAGRSERDDHRALRLQLDRLHRVFAFDVLVIEHPFLYAIAQWVGSAKQWAASRRGVRWYMIGASSAKKTVLGKGSASKSETLAFARRAAPRVAWVQHTADAYLYAVAYLRTRQ